MCFMPVRWRVVWPLLAVWLLCAVAFAADPVAPSDATTTAATALLAPPLPPSPVIRAARFDFSACPQFGRGSDQWPMTWLADGDLLAAWGDGTGWDKAGDKRSIGVTRITGTPPALEGRDLWGEGPGHGFAKPEALVAVGERILMYWTKGDSKGDTDNTCIAQSTDGGSSWTLDKARAFPEAPDGLRVRAICQFGPGYRNARDEYLYVYLGFSRASDLFLMRAPAARPLDPAGREWFAGLDAAGAAQWQRDIAARRPAFSDPNGYLWHVSVVWNPGLRRYLLTKPHYTPGDNRDTIMAPESGLSSLGAFDAPEPWGPWTTVYYEDDFRDALVKFNYIIPGKFISADGRDGWLAWSGWPEYDNVSFVRMTLETHP